MLLFTQNLQTASAPAPAPPPTPAPESQAGGWAYASRYKRGFAKVKPGQEEQIEQVLEQAAEQDKPVAVVKKQVARILKTDDYKKAYLDAYVEAYREVLRLKEEEESEAIAVLLLH